MELKYKLAIELIEHFEGFSAVPYTCAAGVKTVGFGRTHNIKPNEVTTKARERQWILRELYDINEVINKSVWPYMDQHEMASLLSFCYNIGDNAFANSTLVSRLNANDPEASKEMLRWVRGGGKTLPGLLRRRRTEYHLFNNKEVDFHV